MKRVSASWLGWAGLFRPAGLLLALAVGLALLAPGVARAATLMVCPTGCAYAV